MSNMIIGNARERWEELGYDNPDRVDERFRGDPWRLFFAGWTEGRAEQARLIQMLVDEVAAWMQPNLDERFRGEQWHQSKRILDAAAAQGFKPTHRHDSACPEDAADQEDQQ